MSHDLFEAANRLWFHEGRTARALAAYREAVRAAPDDPVVAFQAARALWSFDRYHEARGLLEDAHRLREKLSPAGQRILDDWREELSGPSRQRPFPEIPASSLDRDRLDTGELPEGGWLEVADAAAARRIYGVAAYALDQWEGVPIDAEDAKDIGKVYTDRHLDEAMLPGMYAGRDARRPKPLDVDEKPTVAATMPPTPRPPASAERPAPPAAAAGRAPRVERSARAARSTLPLSIEVRVTPEDAPVGTPTTVVATLRNVASEPLLINRRMLLNREGAPGEIWLDLSGPEGYRNRRGFRIRVGAAGPEFFVTLAPGESVERSWTLDDYRSLDVPGAYEVAITYHNESPHAPDGRPLATGQTSATARFTRA
jgi:hypothetical protein